MKQKAQRAFHITLLFFVMASPLLGSLEPEQLRRAIFETDLLRVEELLAVGAYPRGLTYACELLGCLRANADHYYGCGWHISREFQEIAIIKLLLRSGACVNEQVWHRSLGGHVVSPLHILAEKKSSAATHIAFLLLQAGAEVNRCSDAETKTPLLIAVKERNLPIVKLLVKYGPSHKTVFNALRECMLELASKRYRSDITLIAIGRLLITRAMDVSFPQLGRDDLLRSACCFNVTEMVELLLKAGANPNGKDDFDYSPFLLACEHSGVDILQLLLNAGADINCKNGYGGGVLHRAVRGRFGSRGNKEAVKFLLSNPKKQKEQPLLAGLFE